MISIIFTAPKRFFLISWLVQKFTKSPASHTGFRFKLFEHDFVLHVDLYGVRFERFERFMRGRVIVRSFDLTGAEDAFEDLAAKHLGDSYDVAGLFGQAVVLMARKWLKLRWRNPFASPSGMVCSEFVSRLQIPAFAGLDPESTSPADLLVILEAKEASL